MLSPETEKTLKTPSNPEVAEVFKTYPPVVRKKLQALRQLIYETATDNQAIGRIDETLKWGEPAYLTKGGSTIRMDWKKKSPNEYALYFNCRTKLIETFKEIYGQTFHFTGNRAIIFQLDEPIPTEAVKQCIELALTYHQRKHLPLLGV